MTKGKINPAIIDNNSLEVKLITSSDINWYTSVSLEKFFWEFLEHKPLVTGYKARHLMKSHLLSYLFDLSRGKLGVLRFIIFNKGERVGGITLFDEGEYVDIAYWLLPQHQGKGICSKALNGLIDKLDKHCNYKYYRLEIMEDNIKSKALANRLEFMFSGSRASKTGDKIVLSYIRDARRE